MSSLYLMQKKSKNKQRSSTPIIKWTSHVDKEDISLQGHDRNNSTRRHVKQALEDMENKPYHAERKGLSSFRHIFLGLC